MNTRSAIATEKFLAGYNCAQAVLYAFCDELGFDKDTALRLACGFGAGMARKQEVCGAVTGESLPSGSSMGAVRGKIGHRQRKRTERSGNSWRNSKQNTARAFVVSC